MNRRRREAELAKQDITAADGTVKTGGAVLTPEQAEKLEQQRLQYLRDMTDEKKAEMIMNLYAMSVYQSYLPEVSKKYVPIYNEAEAENYKSDNRIRYFDITKWVIDAEEKNMDKLVNVYQVLSREECNIALIYRRLVSESRVMLAISNIGGQDTPTVADQFIERIRKSLKGNFPGVQISEYKSDMPITPWEDMKSEENIESEKERFYYSVAAISNLASDKSEDFVSQNIEKLLDGIVPTKKDEEYTLVLLATPFQGEDAAKAELSKMYSTMSSFVQWQSNSTVSEGMTVGAGVSKGTHYGGNAGFGFFGASLGVGAGWNTAQMVNTAGQVGKNTGTTKTYTNYAVKHLLDTIEKQITRIEESAALGMWKFAAYAISKEVTIAEDVAHMYLALTQGDSSYVSKASINLWGGGYDKEETKIVLDEISKLKHPEFGLSEEEDMNESIYPCRTYLTTNLSGRDLARALNFPRKSVTGLPVIECAEFGRNISTYDKPKDGISFRLGRIFHMNCTEETEVLLNKDSITSHMFIAGTTNAGKSNTVYKILDEAVKQGVKFLVVEPGKGEYKNIFGSQAGVSVYGTNKNKMPLLRMNPFSFPEDIHVLEHLDRLIEIFNVCWPMYAAMPAVLKNAVEKSYEDCGWDLIESTNEFGRDFYPDFADVARNVRQIIESSEYDSENKGAYKGSLLTRLHSLTNGINGLIFNADEISDKELFNENVIVDLSRIGSVETKSLIMGILVLKLQEYRMTEGGMNAGLKHITVLEEAHNLLRRTSVEQPAESANLLGKSVEMIANAIAEMRTYGEGFIIADQAPGLLDMSVIRNTNTKIVMRLPDRSDRELIGRAANLNENQITELAKLPQGVAAVYQNEWVQPVLCKIDKHELEGSVYQYVEEKGKNDSVNYKERLKIAKLLCSGMPMSNEAILKEITTLREQKIACSVCTAIYRLLQNPSKEPRMTKLAPVMSALFPDVRKAVERAYSESRDPMKWTNAAEASLQNTVGTALQEQLRRDIIQAVMTDYVYHKLGRVDELERWSMEGVG